MRASAKNAQSESDLKGKPAPVAGLYHVTITKVNDSRVKKDGSPLNATVVEFEVLAGSVPGQEGKEVAQFYYLGDEGQETAEYCEKVSRLCMAAGLLKPGEEKDIDAADLENCQVVIEMADYTTKAGKTGVNIKNFGLAIWGVNHPDVASVPKNHEAIRLWNEARGVVGGNGNGNGNAVHANGNGQALVGAGIGTDDI